MPGILLSWQRHRIRMGPSPTWILPRMGLRLARIRLPPTRSYGRGLKRGPAIIAITVVPPPQGTLIALGSAWKWFASSNAPVGNWFQPPYDDTGWSNGLAEFGYGDGDENPQGIIPFGPDANNKW